MEPASLRASTAAEWVTSRTSTSFTNRMLSLTLGTTTWAPEPGASYCPAFPFQVISFLNPVFSPYLRRPSWAAAPPGMILVIKMDGSSPMCGLSVPPAMLKPRPELP